MMKTGKLTPDQLQALIFSQLGKRRDDVLLSAQLGEDSAIIDFGEEACVVSTDPITGAVKNLGKLAVHIACNDLAAMGATPVGIQIALLLPEGTLEGTIKEIMKDIDGAAADLGVQVIGGHTEITAAVNQNVIVATALGRVKRDKYITSGGAKTGDSIILTKGAGLEGAGIIATDFANLLTDAGIGENHLQEARNYLEDISVIKEGLIAAKNGATAMHDITEGGVLGAIFEMAKAANKGFILFTEKIYIPDAVKEVCRILNLDPLALISSGAMLITAREPAPLLEALAKEGIKANVIGKIREEGKKIVYPNGNCREVLTTPRDELWRFLEMAKKEGVTG